MAHAAPMQESAQPPQPIVAVFDTRTMAMRAYAELSTAEYEDIWLGIVRGEDDRGRTTVAAQSGEEIELHRLLAERGSPDVDVHRFDGILPPGTAVMSLRVHAADDDSVDDKVDRAIGIIEMIGGHIDHL